MQYRVGQHWTFARRFTTALVCTLALTLTGCPQPPQQITMKGDDPKQLSSLVNAVAKAYVEYSNAEDRKLIAAQRSEIAESYTKAYEEIVRKRKVVHRLAQIEANPQRAPDRFQLLLDFVAQLPKEIAEKEHSLVQKQQELMRFKREHWPAGMPEVRPMPNAKLIDVRIEEFEERSNELELLESEFREMQKQLKELSQKIDELNMPVDDLGRLKEELAADTESASKLGMKLEQCDVDLRGPGRTTVEAEASVPATPLTHPGHRQQTSCNAGAIRPGTPRP